MAPLYLEAWAEFPSCSSSADVGGIHTSYWDRGNIPKCFPLFKIDHYLAGRIVHVQASFSVAYRVGTPVACMGPLSCDPLKSTAHAVLRVACVPNFHSNFHLKCLSPLSNYTD